MKVVTLQEKRLNSMKGKRMRNGFIAGLVAIMLLAGGCATVGVEGSGYLKNPDGTMAQVDNQFEKSIFHHEYSGPILRTTESVKVPAGVVYNRKTKEMEMTYKYEPKTVTTMAVPTGDRAFGADAVAGFVSGLPVAGGLIGGSALIRPTNVNQTNAGGNAQQNQLQGQQMKQGQLQFQKQKGGNLSNVNVNSNLNNNTNKAYGGAGGTGIGIGGAGGAGGNSIDATNSAVSVGTGNVTTNH